MGLKAAAGAAVLTGALSGCGLGQLSYPDAPPIPTFARELAQDTGSDNDDPMRSRLRVIDIGSYSASDLAAFYRKQFSTAAGWQEQPVTGEQRLCLVRKGEAIDLIEIIDYRGTRVQATPERYLVSSTVFEGPFDVPADACGETHGWTPVDLLGQTQFPVTE